MVTVTVQGVERGKGGGGAYVLMKMNINNSSREIIYLEPHITHDTYTTHTRLFLQLSR